MKEVEASLKEELEVMKSSNETLVLQLTTERDDFKERFTFSEKSLFDLKKQHSTLKEDH